MTRQKEKGLCLRLIIRGAHTLGVKVVFFVLEGGGGGDERGEVGDFNLWDARLCGAMSLKDSAENTMK